MSTQIAKKGSKFDPYNLIIFATDIPVPNLTV